MEQALIDFAGRLRAAGVPVSTAEVIDAGRAAGLVGPSDRTLFKDALRSVLVKRSPDIPVFDALFDLFFTRGPRPGSTGEDEPGGERPKPEDMASDLAEALEMHRPDMSLTAELVMTGQFAALTRLLLGRARGVGLERMESPLQAGFFARQFRRAMDVDRVREETEGFLAALKDHGLDPGRLDRMRQYVSRNIEGLEGEIRGLVQRELARSRFQFVRRMEEEELYERPPAHLSPEEVASMRSAVDRLARRLKDRLGQRYRKHEAGRLDLKAVMRKNIGLGGPLPYLRFRRKKPARPRIMALCDVSGSVSNFSRFMLLFLYSLKEVVSRVRSFIFVGDLAEVTGLFRRHGINEAVGLAASGHGLRYVFRTDYGSVLGQFADEYLMDVDKKTTLFILGDARSNYFNPRPGALEEVAARARRVIWLNPEPKVNWRLGDSVIEAYEPYCTRVAECGNLNQLSAIIEENLVP